MPVKLCTGRARHLRAKNERFLSQPTTDRRPTIDPRSGAPRLLPKLSGKNNVPLLVYTVEFCYYGSMTRDEQRHKVLKAKVALALYSEYGRVPKEREIDEVYHLSRVLYKAVLGTHFLKKQQQRTRQLVLF